MENLSSIVELCSSALQANKLFLLRLTASIPTQLAGLYWIEELSWINPIAFKNLKAYGNAEL